MFLNLEMSNCVQFLNYCSLVTMQIDKYSYTLSLCNQDASLASFPCAALFVQCPDNCWITSGSVIRALQNIWEVPQTYFPMFTSNFSIYLKNINVHRPS